MVFLPALIPYKFLIQAIKAWAFMKQSCRNILNKARSWRGVVFRGAPVDLPGTKFQVAACLLGMRLTAARVRSTRPAKELRQIILTGDFNAKIALPEDGSIQKESRNGKIMAEFIENTGLIPISTKPQHGLWTRENRHDPNEKSVIDYVLTTPLITGQTKNLNIDEEGTLRMQGRKESDHNTITYEVTGKIRKNTKRKLIWRTNNEDAWNNFNKAIENVPEEITNEYHQFERYLKNMMETHPGKITITPGTIRKPSNPQIKKLKRAKKAAKKNFEKACRTKIGATGKLKEYYDTQRKLRETLEKYERERIEKITDEISRKGGTNSIEFWKIWKRIVKPPN